MNNSRGSPLHKRSRGDEKSFEMTSVCEFEGRIVWVRRTRLKEEYVDTVDNRRY